MLSGFREISAVVVAATLAYVSTPLAILAAKRLSFYDRPVGYKGHSDPTPYLGGAAVMLAFTVALVVGTSKADQTLPLLGGLAGLWALGTVDDRRNLSPLVRVAIEFTTALMLSLFGLGWHVGAGHTIDGVLTGLWVVAVINAFNLFDNMDGAASSMGVVVAAGTAALGAVNGNAWAAGGGAALCGACLGFLPHNLAKPSRIFLGDGGSVPLGLAVAMLVPSAVRGSQPAALSLCVGLLLVGVPVLDTTLVIISRRRRRVPILAGAQDHLTHRTRARFHTAGRVALVLGAIQAVVSASVIIATRSGPGTVVYILLAVVICAVFAILGLEPSLARSDEPSGTRAVRTPPRLRPALTAALLITLGMGAGLSALSTAYYNTGVWIPIGLLLVLAAAMACVVRRVELTTSFVLTFSGLAGLGIFSLASSAWAAGAEQAITDGNRWLAYAAFLLLAALLLRQRWGGRTLLAAVGTGIAVTAGIVLVKMLGQDLQVFTGGRLNYPLGYINGEGCLFGMACWLSLALAERKELRWAGPGAGFTVIFAGLTLLSESRGAAIAMLIASMVGLLALPGRRRRLFAITVVGVGLGVVGSTLIAVYSSASTAAGTGPAEQRAAIVLLVAALATGAIWTLLLVGARRLQARPSGPVALRRIAAVSATLIILAPLTVATIRAGSIERTVRTQWHAFVNVSDPGTSSASNQTRLLSGAGNRYDYWRVAWHVFTDHPVAGVGAGNYTASYYLYRQTTESIENPHSLELQTVSELGLVGLAFLALMLGGVVRGLNRLRLRARASAGARTLVVASTGVFTVWLVDTSGDWMHLLPGVTAVALAAVAAACCWPFDARVGSLDASHSGKRRSPLSVAGGAVLALVLAVSGANLLRQGLAHRYLTTAQGELAANPAAAIKDSGRALRLDGASLDAYYVMAAGEARFDRAAAARATLLNAAREDPQAFVTWVLLGDLEVRLANYAQARLYYLQAKRLDPNDPSLTALARDPRSALGG